MSCFLFRQQGLVSRTFGSDQLLEITIWGRLYWATKKYLLWILPLLVRGTFLISKGSFFLVHGFYKKMLSDQALIAWMATKVYSVPLVADFPHSWFLVPEIFWQASPLSNNEETDLSCLVRKWSSNILWILGVIPSSKAINLGHHRFAIWIYN
jgi:hypothetical protein